MSNPIENAITMRALIEVDNQYAMEENRHSGKIALNIIGELR